MLSSFRTHEETERIYKDREARESFDAYVEANRADVAAIYRATLDVDALKAGK